MELLAKQLATAMPTLRAPRVWLSVLNEAMERFEIASSAHIAAFLVQVARDSKECRYLEDDLRYPAEALMRMWPNQFPTLATARPYERNPEKLANFVYSDRLGNGPPESCDGYRYRGRAIGDSLDNDGRIGALQGMLISEHDRTWTALLQFAQINRDDTEKAPGTQTVSATAADLWNFEVGHGRPLGRGTLSLGLGFERFEHKDSGDTEDSPRFMLQWESTQ